MVEVEGKKLDWEKELSSVSRRSQRLPPCRVWPTPRLGRQLRISPRRKVSHSVSPQGNAQDLISLS